MNDSMQFGPEWLRNLSHHDDENTMVTPKYQLAEHRYGREEMLALFDRSVVAPDPLCSISGLYMEKLQLPLALIQMSELETRVWNSNVNNDNSQRNMIKSGPGPVPIVSQSGGNLSMSRGRGISVDRGKSRPSRGPHHYNHRNYLEEGAESPHPGTAFSRSRIFERSQSHYTERNWTERNGNIDYGEWNGYNSTPENGLSTSPRKDFGSSTRLMSSREDTNWRRRPNINKDEDDSWRSNKYGRPGYYWRESGERDREKEKDFEGQETNKDRRWISRVSNMHSVPNRYDSETKDDCLPEWATESPNEGGGTFDSSGAFHGSHSDDEEALQENDCKLPDNAEKERKKTKNDPCSVYDCEKMNRSKLKLTTCDQKNKTKNKSVSLIEMFSSQTIESIGSSQQHSDAYPRISSSSKSTVSKPSTCQLQESNSNTNNPTLSCEVDYYDTAEESGKVYNIIEDTAASKLETQIPSQSITKQLQQLQHEAFQQLSSKMEFISTNHGASMTSAFDSGFNSTPMNSNILQNLNEEGYQTGSLMNKSLTTSPDVDGRISSMHEKNDNKSELTPTINPLVGLKNFNSCRRTKDEDLNCIVGDVVSKFMAEEEEEEKSKKLDGMNKWYYRDPQGQVQGPFPNTEMAEWFKLGYFHDKSLIVRRACEDSYYPLHDLVTYLNGSPFETVTPQNFRKYSRVTLPDVQLNTIPNTHTLPPLPISTNVSDESFLLSQMQQHYQTSLPYEALYARQQQIIAAKKRQLLQSPDGIKSLFDHQELMSRHMVGAVDANSGVSCGPGTTLPQSVLPMVPGYIHPVVPSTVPSSGDPNFVMMLSQMQHQQHVHQQLLQQQLQRHHNQQQPLLPPQRLKDIKSDQLQQLPSSQPDLISYLDDSVQQLVHKISTLSSAKQIPPVPAPNSPLVPPCSSNDAVQTEGFSLASEEKTEQTNVIQNLLKQLGVSAEKQLKPADSIWGTSSISVPTLNNNSFNAQNWCSQVGKIGPTPPSNTGPARMWMQDNTLPTATMITEQEIIETFMKSMQLQRDDSKKKEEEKLDLPKKEEEPILQEAEIKKSSAKVEKEKRKKQQEEAEKNCKMAEQTHNVVEDAKRKEEKWRKAEDKLKCEEHKEQDRVAKEEKKQYDVQSQDLNDMHQKQVDAMKRLKQQQTAATEASKSQKLASSFVLPTDQKPPAVSRVQKLNVSIGSYGKQTGNVTSGGSVSDMKTNKVVSGKDNIDPPLRNQQSASSKQIDKSKPNLSVATSNQKTVNGEKKVQEKKKKDKTSTNAWADQKKIPQVKSLAEIQAEEQKKLAKQIEKEKRERLLQQQQATVNTKTAKEAVKFNIWKSQNQPWKNNWASIPPALANNSNSIQAMSENVPSRQSNTASASVTNVPLTCSGGSKGSAISNVNVVSSQHVPTNKNDESLDNFTGNDMNQKNKSKKDSAVCKKALSSSSTAVTTTQANLRSDELTKWSVKALSSLKVSVDVPTFVGFLREVESPCDVMEYVTDYLGDGKEIKNFVKQFLEKRSAGSFITLANAGTVKKLKNKKSAGEENPLLGNKRKEEEKSQINRTNSGEFLEVKAKSKKSAKKKVMRVDTALLGFNVTAAPNRINIGERDMGEDVY